MGTYTIEGRSLSLNTLLVVFEKDPLSIKTDETTKATCLKKATTTSPRSTTDVSVPSIIAVPGEITTVQACRITPQGDWLYVSVSVYYNQTSHVIEKFHYNQTVEKPDLVDRFSVVTGMSYDDIIVNMTLNLTAPTTDICSLDHLYKVSCSVTMNDIVKSEWANMQQLDYHHRYGI
ncbi:uncharacterized protein LOC134265794 [Saccostrea cucullata]|uniref:uncharacterized protein LOC134265794 n=1 Tax=Saccostrea cuccullata TaxID=36930 RepID=UPI002ED56151